MLSRRSHRAWSLCSAVLVAALAGQQLATVLHLATTEHRLCGEHGHWEHVDEAEASDRSEAKSHHSFSAHAASSPAYHEHHGCQLALHEPSSNGAEGEHVAAMGEWRLSEARPVLAVAVGIAVERLAPKQSPPHPFHSLS